jgi:hypothetical protein
VTVVGLFPANLADYDAALASSLAAVPDGRREDTSPAMRQTSVTLFEIRFGYLIWLSSRHVEVASVNLRRAGPLTLPSPPWVQEGKG